jgi:hypothetical protein
MSHTPTIIYVEQGERTYYETLILKLNFVSEPASSGQQIPGSQRALLWKATELTAIAVKRVME